MPIDTGNGAIRMYVGPSQLGGQTPPPDDIEVAIVDFIDGARDTLDVAVQELEDEVVTRALCRAAGTGVRVRVILERQYVEEPKASADDPFVDVGRKHSANRRMLGALLASGIHVTVDLNPKIFHQKYIVRDRDGTSARAGVLTGSANFTPTGLRSNLNHVVIFRGKSIAATFHDEFEEMWTGTFGELRPRHDPKPRRPRIGGVPVKVLFAPDHAPEMEIMKQVLKAERRVDFAIFTFAESSGIDDTLTAIARRGIKVRGVLDRMQANQRWAATHHLLAVPSIELHRSTRRHALNKLHHKLMVLDEQVIIAGSFNYTEPATRLNDENIVVIGDLSSTGESRRRQRRLASYAVAEIDRIARENAEPL